MVTVSRKGGGDWAPREIITVADFGGGRIPDPTNIHTAEKWEEISESLCLQRRKSISLSKPCHEANAGVGPQVEAGPAARGAAGPHTLSLPRSSTGCSRNWPPTYVNSPMVKLASLHSISPQSQEPIDDVTYNRT